MRTLFYLVFFFTSARLQAQAPHLVIPIGHTSSLSSVAFSPDGKYVLTGSFDKTAKLWDLAGHEIQTFSGHQNTVNSVAFSPDGQYVLTASEERAAKLWDLTGHQIQAFTESTSTLRLVAFSPDGKTVLTGSNDGTAKLWDLSGGEIRSFKRSITTVTSLGFSPDGKFILTGYEGIFGNLTILWDLNGQEIQTFSGNLAAFSPDGKMVVTGDKDGTTKLWDLSGQEIQTFAGHAGPVQSVAFSPNGKFILSSFKDNKNNLTTLWNLAGKEQRDFFGYSGVFSADGKTVLTISADRTATIWDLSGQAIQNFSSHTSPVWYLFLSSYERLLMTATTSQRPQLWSLDKHEVQIFPVYLAPANPIAFSPDFQYILMSQGKTAKLFDLSGREIQSFEGHKLPIMSVAFSPDGKKVLTGSFDQTAKLWDLKGHEIQTFSGHTNAIWSVAFSPSCPDDPIGGTMVLTGSFDHTARLWDLKGHEIQTFAAKGARFWSVTFSPDGKNVLTGMDNNAILWDLKGHEIQTFSGHTDHIRSVTFSLDGKLVMTGSDDNTTKLWDTQSGKEQATLVTIDSADWVVTTPSGLFDASPGAMQLIHYIQGINIVPLDQLKDRYYEPGLLAKITGFIPGGLRDVVNFELIDLYPEIKARIEKNQLVIELTERSGGIGKVSLFINGKEVQEDLNPLRKKKLAVDLHAFTRFYRGDANNVLALRAFNVQGWLKSPDYELSYLPAPTKDQEKIKTTSAKPVSARPSLYAIVVGTSDYAGDQLDLRFADQDAATMAEALTAACGALFGADHTHVQLFSTGGNSPEAIASKANVQQAFQNIATKAQSNDVLMVYFSGHGLAYGPAEKEQFYYLTKDIVSEDLSDPEIRRKYTISSDDLTQWLLSVPAQKQVMIIDACNSGKIVPSVAATDHKNLDPSQIRAFDRMKNRTGTFILTGSAADQVSYEASQYGQGLLTYSLLQGMSGPALAEGKVIDVMKLFQYARDVVPELAKGIGGIQTPVLSCPAGDASSFDIGMVGPGVIIPVAQAKPVFIRSAFQDENYKDDLQLVKALDDYLQQITSGGISAKLIYTDVNEYENGYSIRGAYSMSGNEVEVKGSLFKGKMLQSKFQVTGKKNDLPRIVEAIVNKVLMMIP